MSKLIPLNFYALVNYFYLPHLDLQEYFLHSHGLSRPRTDGVLTKHGSLKTLTLSSGKNTKCWALVSFRSFIEHQRVISMTVIQFFPTLLFVYIFSLKFVIFGTGKDFLCFADSCKSEQSLSGNNIKAVKVLKTYTSIFFKFNFCYFNLSLRSSIIN